MRILNHGLFVMRTGLIDFFLDIEGRLEDLQTTFLMKKLRRMTADFKIVGQYRADTLKTREV